MQNSNKTIQIIFGGVLVLLIIAGIIYFAVEVDEDSQIPNEEVQEQELEVIPPNGDNQQISIDAQETGNTIPSGWKTYTNDELGFSFQYPETWSKNGEDVKVIDLSGTVKEINISFSDPISETTLLMAYHLAPTGAELYHYKISHYRSPDGLYATSSKEVEVAGQKGLMVSDISSMSGKGEILNPPIKSIIVDFLDMEQTGTIELQFQTPVTNEHIEIPKLNQLLGSFQFIN